MFAALVCCASTSVAMLAAGAHDVEPSTGEPPDFAPVMVLAYSDPDSGERVECGEGCRRFTVPDGVDLEVRVRVENHGGPSAGDGVAWDLWFDQPLHPYPGLDLEACYDADGGLDEDCWNAMSERVDRALWEPMIADRVCVPSQPGACWEATVHLRANAEFAGSRRRGVYHVAVWVDRFAVVAERNEFDNYAGPVRVTVEPRSGGAAELDAASPGDPDGFVIRPAAPKPYNTVRLPAAAEKSFSLASERATAVLEFVPDASGEVEVDVDQGGGREMMVVTVVKASTGEVLIEQQGRGRIVLDGRIGPEHLKDDRVLRVEVKAAAGARGLRGVIGVEYPARTLYRLLE